MSPASWAAYIAATLLAAAFTLWLYLRREPAVRGRLVLAALRIAAFALALLLLFDPPLPGGQAGGARDRTRVLLDGSASMGLPERAGAERTRWQAAGAEAKRRGGGVIVFGESVRPVAADSLGEAAPGDARTLLLPALQAAAESGAERVVVLTDGGIEDADVLGGWIARLGLGVEWVRVGQALPGLALAEVAAPGWARAGEPVDLEVTLAATGAAGDSARVVVRQQGRAIGEATLPVPADGRTVTGRVSVRPGGSAEGGYEQLEVSLEPGDAVTDDDRRTVSLFVSPDPAGVAVVSLQPDQEPRFLLPVLTRALGVPVRGYLRTGQGGWVRVAEGAEAGQRLTEGDVARSVARADLLVLHGPGASPPAWVIEALRAAPRLLVFPGSAPVTGLPLPVTVGEPLAGDWFLASEVPASPVAALLADVAAAPVPPLATQRAAETVPGAWAPLRVTRGRGGEPAPLLLAGEGSGRRWAVALGEGYWRWAFRGGEPRQLYERLWAAVAGWLVQDEAGGGGDVRPVRRVVARGEASAWMVPGLRPDSLRLRFARADGLVRDTVLTAALGDTLLAPVLPPGAWRWQATAWAGERTAGGEGVLDVERYSAEYSRPAVPLEDISAARSLGDVARSAPVRPLHASPFPYVLIVLLLAAEWILRRRWGLR